MNAPIHVAMQPRPFAETLYKERLWHSINSELTKSERLKIKGVYSRWKNNINDNKKWLNPKHAYGRTF